MKIRSTPLLKAHFLPTGDEEREMDFFSESKKDDAIELNSENGVIPTDLSHFLRKARKQVMFQSNFELRLAHQSFIQRRREL